MTCPKNVKRPVLPHKYDGETIFPTGEWTGVYFTEELKAVEGLGYKFEILKYWEFSREPLFFDYVNNFYEQKKNAKTPSERLIAKMHLNQLYGVFGRRLDAIETVNVYNKDIINYMGTKIVTNVIEINDEISTLLIRANLNTDIIKAVNEVLTMTVDNKYSIPVKSNVAIASAVTA